MLATRLLVAAPMSTIESTVYREHGKTAQAATSAAMRSSAGDKLAPLRIRYSHRGAQYFRLRHDAGLQGVGAERGLLLLTSSPPMLRAFILPSLMGVALALPLGPVKHI
eukprot:8791152-Pyramimonas_sp.AAC.1